MAHLTCESQIQHQKREGCHLYYYPRNDHNKTAARAEARTEGWSTKKLAEFGIKIDFCPNCK